MNLKEDQYKRKRKEKPFNGKKGLIIIIALPLGLIRCKKKKTTIKSLLKEKVTSINLITLFNQ